MLLSIRAGRASRPGAAIGRLVTRRAHRLPDRVILWPATRWQTYATKTAVPGIDNSSTTLSKREGPEARYNQIGVQQLSSHVHSQVFRDDPSPPPQELIDLSIDHLRRHDLYGKNTDTTPPISFDLPKLQGDTLDEHFYRLGIDASEPYLTFARMFAKASMPQRPRKWQHRSGWTKYNEDGTTEVVDAPNEEMLCFDTEVMWKESSFAVMACANNFLDTMSLHVAVNGMCSRQRPTWMKHRKSRELREKIAGETNDAELAALLGSKELTDEEEDLWVGRSSINSLRDVAKFHLGVTIDKAQRDQFGESDREGILEKLEDLLHYCAADVDITHRVYQKVFPNFIETCPHPVSFAALRHLSSVILPVDRSWESYVANAEATYHRLSDAVQERLIALKDKALEIKDNPEQWSSDPWLRQLDWSGQEIRMVKGKKKDDPPRPALRQKMAGSPKWYKDLYPKVPGPINLTVRTRIAPLLLRLAWDGHPLVWSDKYGWTFRVPLQESHKYTEQQMQECTAFEEKDIALRDDRQGVYFKVPHKDGPMARCANPMAKSYLPYFEKGILSSEFEYAKEALEMNASCSYWISARNRIMSQMVVYAGDGAKGPAASDPESETGYILPQVIPMGTVTRRAVENTWLTASNAKKNRVGSELKSMIKAPPGYSFVGADVDSEELWIASLVGDAQFKMHGGNAVGFMTLEGTKAAGTDLHSRTAAILDITRNDAKVFNYGRIYGAGLKFASTLLRQFNPSLSESETLKVAGNLYKATKGLKTNRKALHPGPFWRGGTESFVFNKLEEFAEQERPRTPVLGAGITEALMSKFVSKGGFMTSRINWAIQSSGVDYLHLLIISMDYLIRRYNIQARLTITVHDEIRYLVKNEDKYRAAMALQVSNLWTRAMFSQQMGINDLPQSCAYFSAVDIDHVLRKEVNMDCITPSHKNAIPHGESLDIQSLLLEPSAHLDPNIVPTSPVDLSNIPYIPRIPVMQAMQPSTSASSLNYLKAQITADDAELKEILKEQRKIDEENAPLKPKVSKNKILPYQAYAHLMEEPIMVSDALGKGFQKTFEGAKARNWGWNKNVNANGGAAGKGARW
ncbi:hypothetical protein CJF30_00008195 [Rutstroemia sp. NJR-2017a BBW]|nr:hypothetical protein CJF30_00008195 [Rutstroemia sp. NJR-2017a BBW]